MTILYILDYGTVGGATKAFIDLCREMHYNGLTPIVVTGKRNELNEMLERDGISTIAAGHFTALDTFTFEGIRWPIIWAKRVIRYYIHEYLALRILARKVDFSEVSLIHTNSARNTLGCRLSKKYGIPHIIHIREFGDTDFKCIRLTPNYITLLNHYSIIFLSVSKAVQNHWNKKGVDEKKNILLYDGVNYHNITKSSNEGKKGKVLRMVINGGVIPAKGQHLAVEAIGFLPAEIRKNVTLDIVGWYSEEYVDMMKLYARERGYSQQINFLGSRDDVHERMGQYQLGLMCSRSEGFGLVTVEYMLGQLGVIASDSGACPELIDNGETGLLFKSGSSVDLSRCIALLYNDRDLLARLSINAREKALHKFTAEINANNILKVYQQILK